MKKKNLHFIQQKGKDVNIMVVDSKEFEDNCYTEHVLTRLRTTELETDFNLTSDNVAEVITHCDEIVCSNWGIYASLARIAEIASNIKYIYDVEGGKNNYRTMRKYMKEISRLSKDAYDNLLDSEKLLHIEHKGDVNEFNPARICASH